MLAADKAILSVDKRRVEFAFYSVESEKLFHCSTLVLQVRDCFHSNSIFCVCYANDVVARSLFAFSANIFVAPHENTR